MQSRRRTASFLHIRRSFGLFILAVTVVLSGCAHGYSAIETQSVPYGSASESESVTFEYRLNALEAAGNGGFAKKSRKESVAPIPLRVTNNRDEAVRITRETLDVTSGSAAPYLVPAAKAADDIGQAHGWHALWGLLNVFYTGPDGNTIYLPVGPAIGLFNIIRGASANSSLESDFNEKSLYGRSIEPGQSAQGLVFVADGNGQPLEFVYRGSGATSGTN